MNKKKKNLIFFNMGFFDEILNLFKGEEFDSSFKIVLLGATGAAIEGYRRIGSMSESEIVVELKNGKKISLVGIKLYIKKLEKEEMVVAGNIIQINVI